ncbi:MAG: ABC transporter substrate-binding protein, partial [Saprospiraceae bacterium]
FSFVKWIDKSGLFLKTNKDYHDSVSHNLEGIRTSFIPDRSIALLEIINGNLDYMSGLESSYVNTALDKNGDIKEALVDKIKILKNPYLNFEYLGINQQLAIENNSILQYKNVRQALNMSIDRSLMLNSLRNGVGEAADSGVIPKGLPSYDPIAVVGYRYDITKAKSLLESVNGIDLSEPLIISTSKDYLDLTTFIARQWEELGLNIEMDVMESAMLRDKMRKSAISVFRASWILDYPDGENYLSLFYSKNPAPPNYTRYSNPDFDVLYEEAILSMSQPEKMVLYHQMNQIIVEDAPVIFLFYDQTANFYRKEIRGMPTNAINFLNPKAINL